jgi:hypothetical protein
MAEVRIATFNLENFDETAAGEWPSLAERLTLMRPQIEGSGPTLHASKKSTARNDPTSQGRCSR